MEAISFLKPVTACEERLHLTADLSHERVTATCVEAARGGLHRSFRLRPWGTGIVQACRFSILQQLGLGKCLTVGISSEIPHYSFSSR